MTTDGTPTRPGEVYTYFTREQVREYLLQNRWKVVGFRHPDNLTEGSGEYFLPKGRSLTVAPSYDSCIRAPRLILRRIET